MCPTFCVSSVDHFESANASPFSWFDQILRIGGSLAKFTSNDLFLANISICTVISVQRCITSSIVKKNSIAIKLCALEPLSPKIPLNVFQSVVKSRVPLRPDCVKILPEYFSIAKQSISSSPNRVFPKHQDC